MNGNTMCNNDNDDDDKKKQHRRIAYSFPAGNKP